MMKDGRILVVDDEPTVLEAMHSVLGEEYELSFAKNGIDALDLARRQRPGLILLDIKLPDVDGYAVCCALMADPITARIPVIFVSGQAPVEGVERALSLPSIEYLAKPFSPAHLRERVRSYLCGQNTGETLAAVGMLVEQLNRHVSVNDEDASLHPWRVASYAVALAAKAGWAPDRCKLLEYATPLHNIGKLGIPQSVLVQGVRDDAENYELFKTHTQIGHTMLVKQRSPVFDMAAEIALYHHEKWDGSGYPEQLEGIQIPESARIVAIADVFDSLTTSRPQHPAWSIDIGMATLYGAAGSYFDPSLVIKFEAIMPEIKKIKAMWEESKIAGTVGVSAKKH